ncbi:hypothetical protein MSPP1_001914 [Malassezia sp. CBS 17886]|nr:hypothetical protein MSPP1_001914 [Malassezia sp. CBS 17886]
MDQITFLSSGATSRAHFQFVRALEAAQNEGAARTHSVVHEWLLRAQAALSTHGERSLSRGDALVIVLQCARLFPDIDTPDVLAFVTVPVLHVLAQCTAENRVATVAWQLLAHLVPTPQDSTRALSPLILRNTMREHLVRLLATQGAPADDAALHALACGVPATFELLPAVATPLLHLTYHPSTRIRRLAMHAMAQGTRSEAAARAAPRELAPVVLARVLEMVGEDGNAQDGKEGGGRGGAPKNGCGGDGEAGGPAKRAHEAEWSPPVLRVLVRLILMFTVEEGGMASAPPSRSVPASTPPRLSPAQALALLATCVERARASQSSWLLVAAADAVRAITPHVDGASAARAEQVLVRAYAERGVQSTGAGFAVGLGCARALGALWERRPPCAPADAERAAQEKSVTLCVRSHTLSANRSTRLYVLSVLHSWACLGWMDAAAGDTFAHFGLAPAESERVMAWGVDDDAGVRAQVERLCEQAVTRGRVADVEA